MTWYRTSPCQFELAFVYPSESKPFNYDKLNECDKMTTVPIVSDRVSKGDCGWVRVRLSAGEIAIATGAPNCL